MTTAELRETIEEVLGQVEFNPPVSIEYCEQVWKELKRRYPKGIVEVFHRHKDLNVLVIQGATRCLVSLPLV